MTPLQLVFIGEATTMTNNSCLSHWYEACSIITPLLQIQAHIAYDCQVSPYYFYQLTYHNLLSNLPAKVCFLLLMGMSLVSYI